MRQTIITIFIFIFSFSQGHGQTIDSLRSLYYNAKKDISGESYVYAAKTLTKIIQTDSSYYKIFYLRGICYLLASEETVLDSNNFPKYNFTDSVFVVQGINDLKKCIQLNKTNPKTFPEDFGNFDKEYEINQTYNLGEKSMLTWNSDIIDGVLVYITSNGKNKKIACDCWAKALDQKVYMVDILINEFCK